MFYFIFFLPVTILINNRKNSAYKENADFNVDSLEEIGTLLSSTFEVQRDKTFITDVLENTRSHWNRFKKLDEYF